MPANQILHQQKKGRIDNTGRKTYRDFATFFLRPNEVLVGGHNLIFEINEKKEDFAKIYVDEVNVTETTE